MTHRSEIALIVAMVVVGALGAQPTGQTFTEKNETGRYADPVNGVTLVLSAAPELRAVFRGPQEDDRSVEFQITADSVRALGAVFDFGIPDGSGGHGAFVVAWQLPSGERRARAVSFRADGHLPGDEDLFDQQARTELEWVDVESLEDAARCTSDAPAAGWVCVGDGWVPPDHPLAGGPVPPAVPVELPSQPTFCPGTSPGPGWACAAGGWLPPNHPLMDAGGAIVMDPPSQSGFLWMQSDAEDRVGRGRTLLLPLGSNPATSTTAGRLTLTIPGISQPWTIRIGAPGSASLVIGAYENTVSAPTTFQAGLDVRGDGRSCSTQALGRMVIADLAFSGAKLVRLRLSFEQRCSTATAGVLRGEIWFVDPAESGAVVPDGPAPGPPASAACSGLAPAPGWRCLNYQWISPLHPNAGSPGAVLMEGPLQPNFARFRSDAGHSLGRGWTYLLQIDPRAPSVIVEGTRIRFTIPDTRGAQWTVTFTPPGTARFQVGTYVNTRRAPNSFQAGLDVLQGSGGCAADFGQVKVSEIAFDGQRLTNFRASFEHRCTLSTGPQLTGEIRFVDPVGPGTALTGDPNLVVAGAESVSCFGPAPGPGWGCGPSGWLPPGHALVASGVAPPLMAPTQPGFLWLESEAGDHVGSGWSHLLRLDPNPASVVVSGAAVTFTIPSTLGSDWRLRLEAPGGGLLKPGIYEDTRRGATAFHAGLSMTGEGSGCSRMSGRLEIRDIAFDGARLLRLRAAFEQRCDLSDKILRGEIWFGDESPGSNPVIEVIPTESISCAGISPGPGWRCRDFQWLPPGHPLAASSSAVEIGPPSAPGFLWIESDPGHIVEQGSTHLLRIDPVGVSASSSSISLMVPGTRGETWHFRAEAPDAGRLQPGIYERTRFSRSALHAGLSLSGDHGCSSAAVGRLVIADIALVGATLRRLRASFELRCGATASALRGEIWFGDLLPAGTPPPELSVILPDESRSCFGNAPAPDWVCSDAQQWMPPSHPAALAGGGVALGPPKRPGFVWVESDRADFIAAGWTHWLQLDPRPSSVTGNPRDVTLVIPNIEGNPWRLEVRAPVGDELRTGVYASTRSTPDATHAGLRFTGDGRGCTAGSGRLEILDIAFSGSTLIRLRARFSQLCGTTGPPTLRGEIWYER